jgi:chromosome segregation ATPase
LADSIQQLTQESLKLTESVAIDQAGNEKVVSKLDELFSDNSPITNALNAIKDSVIKDNASLDINADNLQNITSAILSDVPYLIQSIGEYAVKLQAYSESLTDWMQTQTEDTEATQKNTEAIGGLTNAVENLTTKLDNTTVKVDLGDVGTGSLDLYD